MAVKLRLKRMGKKRQPIYKVVAADARSPRDGKFIETIGLYNPKINPSLIEINEDRAMYWLGVGAIPTFTVRSLLNKKGILLKRELMKRGLPDEEISAKLDEWQKLHEAKTAASLKKAGSEKVAKQEEAKTSEEDTETESTAEIKGAASEGDQNDNK